MIIVSELSEAVSFTDDTSPNLNGWQDRSVSIHAQVLKEKPLDWYYDLLRLYPNNSREIKSSIILSEFQNLPQIMKERIWAGMKEVVVNVVDSLFYQSQFKELLQAIFRKDNALELLKNDARSGKGFAKEMLKRLDEHIARNILFDSPSRKLKSLANIRKNFTGGYGYRQNMFKYSSNMDIDKIDLSPFEKQKKSMANMATKWTSKSGSVFSRAIDQVKDYSAPDFFSWKIKTLKHLSESHAFDEGDSKSIDWIEEERGKIVNDVFLYDFPIDYFGIQKLQEVSSENSFHIQAADIAAGFARVIYERYGLEKLVIKFDHVTFNGQRINENDLEEKVRQWKQIVGK